MAIYETGFKALSALIHLAKVPVKPEYGC
jgi:hypothetical protein